MWAARSPREAPSGPVAAERVDGVAEAVAPCPAGVQAVTSAAACAEAASPAAAEYVMVIRTPFSWRRSTDDFRFVCQGTAKRIVVFHRHWHVVAR